MNIEVSNHEDEAVIRVSGCIDTAAAAEFQRKIDDVSVGAKKVTFDFSGVEFIASSALRVMVSLAKRLSASGGRIAVTGANEVVRDVFEMTGLVEVFEVL